MVLVQLAKADITNPSELTKKTGMSSPHIAKTICSLKLKDEVKRVVDDNDHRNDADRPADDIDPGDLTTQRKSACDQDRHLQRDQYADEDEGGHIVTDRLIVPHFQAAFRRFGDFRLVHSPFSLFPTYAGLDRFAARLQPQAGKREVSAAIRADHTDIGSDSEQPESAASAGMRFFQQQKISLAQLDRLHGGTSVSLYTKSVYHIFKEK